jgi:hypothetical protein
MRMDTEGRPSRRHQNSLKRKDGGSLAFKDHRGCNENGKFSGHKKQNTISYSKQLYCDSQSCQFDPIVGHLED